MTENAASDDRRESSGCGDPFAESNGDSAIGRERRVLPEVTELPQNQRHRNRVK